MKTGTCRPLPGFVFVIFALSMGRGWSADSVKANNTTSLNVAGSWASGGVPGTNDRAIWNNTVTGANTVTLGADMILGTIQILDPGGLVTIGGNILTLDATGTAGTGIDMSGATADLTLFPATP